MIPLKNDTPVFQLPLVTWLLIAVNVAVFLWMRHDGPEAFERTIFEYAAIPKNITGDDITILMYGDEPVAAIVAGANVVPYHEGIDPNGVRAVATRDGIRYAYKGFLLDEVPQKIAPWMTLIFAMFMHAGWMHLIGNMWFLQVFGTSVEDSAGKIAYLVFYLLCGFGATAAQLLHDPNSVIPFLGASGAIAGVMGAFALRFPGAQVLTLVPIVLYTIAHLPAWIFMLIYLGEQIFMSIVHSEENGGVAWWAHIGGFAAGYFLIRFFPITPPWRELFARMKSERLS